MTRRWFNPFIFNSTREDGRSWSGGLKNNSFLYVCLNQRSLVLEHDRVWWEMIGQLTIYEWSTQIDRKFVPCGSLSPYQTRSKSISSSEKPSATLWEFRWNIWDVLRTCTLNTGPDGMGGWSLNHRKRKSKPPDKRRELNKYKLSHDTQQGTWPLVSRFGGYVNLERWKWSLRSGCGLPASHWRSLLALAIGR